MDDPVEILVNRAPVLTLWASVVARRCGYSEEEALTLGKAVAGLTAQSKGRRLGMYRPTSEEARKERETKRQAMGAGSIDFMGREIPCIQVEGRTLALSGTAPIDPDSVRRYLRSKFKQHRELVEEKLTALAAAYPPDEVEQRAMDLYMAFRPQAPKGEKGWGRAGPLDLETISRLTEEASR
jgi:hypothetical protein